MATTMTSNGKERKMTIFPSNRSELAKRAVIRATLRGFQHGCMPESEVALPIQSSLNDRGYNRYCTHFAMSRSCCSELPSALP